MLEHPNVLRGDATMLTASSHSGADLLQDALVAMILSGASVKVTQSLPDSMAILAVPRGKNRDGDDRLIVVVTASVEK